MMRNAVHAAPCQHPEVGTRRRKNGFKAVCSSP
ncbi:hypothetical protein CIB84_011746 [Bambusicola thoracicus]|uniref:Uncharacterized protein n=1 Tax=Bambusicola thoracicus TaxID=9083 RepID=A0A2P4SK66_BAMTH|nr:hypothetical protein CIB84_011746 [Bambusicola thoracicus]